MLNVDSMTNMEDYALGKIILGLGTGLNHKSMY